MTTKVGINGFGRIGRLAFRRIAETSKDLEIVAINDLTSPAMLAHLLKYDTAHGQFEDEVSATENALIVNGKEIPVYAEADARNIPWVKNDGVELVLESTGFYTSPEKAQAHVEAGAKKVLVSAPAGKMKTIVYGVNDDTLTPEDQIVSAASCTTNCLAPLAKAVNDAFGIKAGTMTTIHAYTATQKLQDGPDRSGNVRNARAAAQNTIPHSTGAAKAIGLVVPELNGKLDGHAQRVPVIMPGSPPTRISEPGTIPPPSTLSSSLICVDILSSSRRVISESLEGFPASPAAFCDALEAVPFVFTFSSTKLFHSRHPGHCPIHLEDS